MHIRAYVAYCFAATVLLVSASSVAQVETEALDSEELKKQAMAKTSTTVADGWKVKVNFGGTANFNFSNENAASAGAGEQGSTFQIGIVVGIKGDYKQGQHRWKNEITLQQTQTKQPERSFRKSLDSLEFLSTYLYSFKNPSWLGPFVRFRLNTQILRSSYFNDDEATAWLRESVGSPPEQRAFDTVGSEQRVVQTEPFEPLLLRESAGLFANPFTGETFTFDAKLGVGAQQIIARDGVSFLELRVDDGDLKAVFREIEGSNDVGAEGEVALTGVIVKERLTWRLTANLFLPLVSSGEVIVGDWRDTETTVGFDYAIIDVAGGLSLKLAKWASLDYVLMLRRVPLVVRGMQVQHGILLTAGFDLL